MDATPNAANRSTATSVRRDLAAAYRLIAHFGLDDSIYTHISARAGTGHDRFLINPYGYRFEEVTADNLVTVDLNGELIDDPLDTGINKAGFTIHSAVHAARPDLACVLHTHSVAGVAVSCQQEGILPLNQWALQFHGRVAYHDYEGIALDHGERERLVADLGEYSIMVLRNHGMLVCGRTIGEAFRRMFNLERTCRAQLALQSSGATSCLPSEPICEHTAQQYERWDSEHDVAGRDREWEAWRRLAGRLPTAAVN
ncbi:class II aldolase/adducin family protein [Kushneria aurantia]|uniref:Class II aldolase/adducin family protein n=1 Tax=Kushneria aurantia TaxID=504092 RepID=A0ABV6FZV5_9GAMM|nr:class II aldolase/adducin family protein [Kushneria aurantia]